MGGTGSSHWGGGTQAGVRPPPTAGAECAEEQEDPGPVFLRHCQCQTQKSHRKEETEAQGVDETVQGHHNASCQLRESGWGCL